jgi:hypothetical protein
MSSTTRLPKELERLISQRVVDLTPWHIMPSDLAEQRMASMRSRYSKAYVPFARRQDNDDVACLVPDEPGGVIVVHDYAAEGSERVATYARFWDWFKAAIDDMIEFDP